MTTTIIIGRTPPMRRGYIHASDHRDGVTHVVAAFSSPDKAEEYVAALSQAQAEGDWQRLLALDPRAPRGQPGGVRPDISTRYKAFSTPLDLGLS